MRKLLCSCASSFLVWCHSLDALSSPWFFVLTGKEWSAAEEFTKDAPDRPHVHGEAVEAVRGQHQLGWPIPTGHNVLMAFWRHLGGGSVGVGVSHMVVAVAVPLLAMRRLWWSNTGKHV